LATGEIQDTKPNQGIVEFGRTVTVQVEKSNKPKTYMIVTQHESNPMAGKLALESPLGQVLMGKKVGDVVTFQAPAGPMKYTIIEIK
jgi:transcription elongation factor GreA